MTVLADTKAAMLRYVPKGQGKLRNALLQVDSWQGLARAVPRIMPDWRQWMARPGWRGKMLWVWRKARPTIPDRPTTNRG